MKKLICLLMAALMLCGCGVQKPVETMITAQKPAVPQAAPSDAQTISAEPQTQHLQLHPLDNYEVDAQVLSRGVTSAAAVEMEPLNLTAEQLLSVVFPEDVSQRSVETKEFRRIVTTGEGSSLTLTNAYFTAFRGGYTMEDLWEMEILLSGWAEEHPQDAVHALDFMTPEEAVGRAMELFRQLNVGYEPELKVFAALTGPEINAYQQVCLDDPMYTEFGKFHMLPELGDDHDAYYLSFTFSYDGIPIESPSIVSDTYGALFAPDAAMLITRQGVAYISCMGLQSLTAVGESRPLITPEQAMEGMRQVVQEFYAEASYKTTLIELCYLPLTAGGKTTLVPYWGMEVLDTDVLDLVPPGSHPYSICYWFNAFTGTHFMDE